jgi:hypothetical protein
MILEVFMDHVHLVSFVIGPRFAIIGLWLMLRREEVLEVWEGVRVNPAVFYMGGVLNLLIGFSVLTLCHSFQLILPFLITVIGLLIVVRGLLVLFARGWVIERARGMLPFSKYFGIIPLILGLLIIFLAL